VRHASDLDFRTRVKIQLAINMSRGIGVTGVSSEKCQLVGVGAIARPLADRWVEMRVALTHPAQHNFP
jgi:hypothetical protein